MAAPVRFRRGDQAGGRSEGEGVHDKDRRQARATPPCAAHGAEVFVRAIPSASARRCRLSGWHLPWPASGVPGAIRSMTPELTPPPSRTWPSWLPWVLGVYLVAGWRRIVPAARTVVHGLPALRPYMLWALHHGRYSDIVWLYSLRHLSRHPLLYIHQRFEYPPLVGLAVWLSTWAPGGLGGYIAVNALLLGAALVASVFVLARLRGWRIAALWAATPLLVLYAIYNWDLYGILTWGLAVLAWTRGRYAQSGLWIGLGAATKLFPVVLAPYFMASRLAQHDRRGAAVIGGATAGSWALINLPLALTARPGWLWFFRYNTVRPPNTLWVVAGWSVPTVNAVTFGLVVGGGLLLAAAVLTGRLDPTAAAAAALLWWFACNKVYSPQYSLWALYACLAARASWKTAVMLTVVGVLGFQWQWVSLYVSGVHTGWPGIVGPLYPAMVLLSIAILIHEATVLVRRGWLRSPSRAVPALKTG